MKLINAKHLLQKIHSYTNMYGWGHGSLAIERKLTELIDGEDEVQALVLGKEYSSADYSIITENHKGFQTFKIVRRRSS